MFIPAADEVYRLQGGGDPECQLFEYVAAQGHYANKGGSKQGIYALAPSGKLLGSVNSTEAARVADMLRKAISAWNALPKKERLLQQDPMPYTYYIDRDERFYPVGGLVLRVYMRDLPHSHLPSDWRGKAWNQDIAWFTKDEARSFIPSTLKSGDRCLVPDAIVYRIARCHLVDAVRGQTTPFSMGGVEKAHIFSTITAVKGDIVEIRLDGESRTSENGRGYHAKLLGGARFDVKNDKFTTFELVAVGQRWGSTQYNYRHDDPGPSPMGVLFTLAGSSKADMLAPELFWAYGWR